MTRRPLNNQFNQLVLDEIKETTIRDSVWPVGVAIMLYNWTGLPYRSKQADVTAIIVRGYWVIDIAHREDGAMIYTYGRESHKPLWETEGFASSDAMDAWFRPLVKPCQSVKKYLHLFTLLNS